VPMTTLRREKRFVAPLSLLPFTLSTALDYRVLSFCNLIPVSAGRLAALTANYKLGACLARLLEQGYLLEHTLDASTRKHIGYTLTCAGEIWMNRFYGEHHAALEILKRGKS